MCDLGHTNKTLEWSCSLSVDTVRSGEDTLCITADSSMKPHQAVTTETQACQNNHSKQTLSELFCFKKQNIHFYLQQEIKAVVQLQLCVFLHLRRVFCLSTNTHGVRITKDLITAPESVTQSPQSGFSPGRADYRWARCRSHSPGSSSCRRKFSHAVSSLLRISIFFPDCSHSPSSFFQKYSTGPFWSASPSQLSPLSSCDTLAAARSPQAGAHLWSPQSDKPTLDLVADLHWMHSSVRCSHVVDFQHPGVRVQVWAAFKSALISQRNRAFHPLSQQVFTVGPGRTEDQCATNLEVWEKNLGSRRVQCS